MATDQGLPVVWMFLFGSMTFLFFALPVLSSSCKNTGTSCAASMGYGLNYTLSTPQRCKVIRHQDGSMIQTIPKLFSFPSVVGQMPRLAGKQIICRLPDCVKNLCGNCWCEETKVGYKCHCSTGFQGEHSGKRSTESSITETTTKSTTTSTTTLSEQPSETPSQETTTMSACSSPLEVRNRGSFYNFSTSKMNHSSALSCCSEHDSHLVFIETSKEQNFIKAQIKALDPNVDYWIGLRGHVSSEDTTWWDGSSLRYDNTAVGVEHECFVIKSETKYKWNDRACSNKYKYICEKEMDENE